MKDKETNVYGGVGFSGLLTIVFIVLKLLNVIQWSWLWVLSPIWISLAFTLIIVIVGFVIISIAGGNR